MPRTEQLTDQQADRRSTLHDVAALVGVSPRTVSRVVNDEDGFSEATRQRVLAAISELKYRPNLVARGLVTQQTRTLGLVVTDLSDPFFAELAAGAQRAAMSHSYNVFLSSTENEADQQAQVLDSLRSHGIDGTIVFPATDTDNQLRSAAADVPIVCVDHQIDHPRIGSVSSDLAAGAYAAVEHLVSRGHRRLGMIASKFSPPGRRRREAGFLAGCADFLGDGALGDGALSDGALSDGALSDGALSDGVLSDGASPAILRTEPTLEGGRHATAALLEQDPTITAVFAYNDITAIGGILAAGDRGLSVPDDLAVVGFDDVPLAAIFGPPLTTIRIDRERLGQTAIEMVLAMGNGQDPASQVLPVELVVRSST